MKRRLAVVLLAALACLQGPSRLFGASEGTVSGIIKDASGAVIPNAKLTLTSLSTNAVKTLDSDKNGEFQFIQVPPAAYSLSATATGFKKETVPSLLVQVDQNTHIELAMEVGAVGDVVTVADVAPILESDKSTLSSVVDSRNISDLPLNGRQALDLALITPGVLPAATGTQVLSFNVAGARAQSNMYLWDGVSNMDTQVNGNLNNFRVAEAMQEFSVQTSVASAEFGRGTGGQVSMETKSGGNSVHGSIFEYVRNNDFDATDFFINKSGGKKTPLHRNQFGGTLGGPIVKDKLFVFGSYEEFRQVAPSPSLTRVPTAAERAQVTNPISLALLQFWPTANTTGTNNFITNVASTTFDYTGLMRVDYHLRDQDMLTARYAEYRGEVFTPGALPTEGGNANSPVSRNLMFAETHTFAPNLLNEFRFGYSRNQTKISVQDASVNAASIFLGSNGQALPGVVNAATNPQDGGLPTGSISGGYATLGSTTNLPQGRITNTTEIFDSVSWVAPRGATKHSIKMGFHARREQARRYLDSTERGSLSFLNWTDFAAGNINSSTFKTGSTLVYWDRIPWDIYLQDQYKPTSNLTINFGVRYEYPSAIHQVRKSAVNFVPGVGPVLLGTNELLTVDPTKVGLSSLVLTQSPVSLDNTGVIKDKNNIGPVVGIAYTPKFARKLFGDDATVIRAGFRVGFDDIFNNIPANMGLNAPYNVSTTQTAGVTQPGKFGYDIAFNQNVPLVKFNAAGQPVVGLVGFSAEDPNIRSAYLYQYNMGIQRRLGRYFSIETDYQGSTGHKLGLYVDLNEPTVTVVNPALRGNQAPNIQVYPYPTFGSISTGKDIGNWNYNGGVLTGKFQKADFFVQASYTLSKSIDTNSAFFGSTGELSVVDDPRNISLERGPSSFDTRQRTVIVYNVDLPFGKGKRYLNGNNPFTRFVIGGWTLSGVSTFQGGQPFTVYNTSADFSGFNQLADRLNVAASGPLPTNYSNPDAAFSLAYFGCTRTGTTLTCPPPPTGTVGTSGRNQYYGPHLINTDTSLMKVFPVWRERFKLSFRADLFNVFNHTNFSNPVHNASSSSFGQITQTVGTALATSTGTTAGAVGGPRQIQLAMRLQF